MNCDAAQRRLLAGERSDRPSDDVRRHLAACPICRLWNRRLVQVERQIPLLPVPPSSARDAFVRRFLRTPEPVVRPMLLPWPTPAKERGLRKVSLAVAIAAVLAVFALGWWSWPHQAADTAAPPVVRQIDADRVRLDHILTLPAPRERVEKLAALAADLKDRALALTEDGDADRLAGVAALYSEVVEKDLVRHAGNLSAEDRPAVLKAVAVQLGEAESAFHRLATRDPAASTARPLQSLTLTAHNGGLRIQALLRSV